MTTPQAKLGQLPRLLFALAVSTSLVPLLPSLATAHAWSEDGQASYYGNHWVGHRTTSGARFDQTKLTCAHASLPLGTKLLVTADDTGDSVVVTVNDRQPDHGERIIDLSVAAARRLHMLSAGIAQVTITPAGPRDINAADAEQNEEVADAPDDDTPAPLAPVSHARHGRPHRHHAPR